MLEALWSVTFIVPTFGSHGDVAVEWPRLMLYQYSAESVQ